MGDLRVKFEHVPDCKVTVLALQANEDGCMTFLPFRLLPRFPFGPSQWGEPAALVAEGRKPRDVLAREGRCFAGSRVCSGCNVVAGCCAGVHTPEIFRCFEGIRSMELCFKDIQETSLTYISLGAWAIRLLAWVAMFAGLWLALSQVVLHDPVAKFPVVELLDRFARTGCCLLVTMSLASLIISFAYVDYRPLTSLFWLFVAASIVVFPNVLALPARGAAAESYLTERASLVSMVLPLQWLGAHHVPHLRLRRT